MTAMHHWTAAPFDLPPRISRADVATIAESAWLLGISRTKLYELLSDGTLPSFKIDTRRYVRRADLSRFVDGLRRAS